MAGYNNQNFTPREKNVFDDTRLRLYTKKDENGNSGSLSIAYFSGGEKAPTPRIVVYSPNKEEKKLEVQLDELQIQEVFNAIVDLATYEGNEPRRYRWEKVGFAGTPGKTAVVGQVVVGRDQNGIVYIGANKYGWKNAVRFDFRPHFTFKRVNDDGSPTSESETSRGIARAWVTVLSRLCSTFFKETWKYNPPKSQSNNNSGYSNNNQGSYQQKDTPAPAQPAVNFDEDFNFI